MPDELCEGILQVELHQLHRLQSVSLLLLRGAAAAVLKQRQILAVLHSSKQLSDIKGKGET